MVHDSKQIFYAYIGRSKFKFGVFAFAGVLSHNDNVPKKPIFFEILWFVFTPQNLFALLGMDFYCLIKI